MRASQLQAQTQPTKPVTDPTSGEDRSKVFDRGRPPGSRPRREHLGSGTQSATDSEMVAMTESVGLGRRDLTGSWRPAQDEASLDAEDLAGASGGHPELLRTHLSLIDAFRQILESR